MDKSCGYPRKTIDLELSLIKFCSIFGRSGDIGSVKSSENTNMQITDPLPSSKEVDFLYKHLEIQDEAIIGRQMLLEIIHPNDLIKAQEGWRWNNDTDELNKEWKKPWLVFGNRNDDVLIADTSTEQTPILGCIQGKTFIVAKSMARFFDVYGDWMLCERDDFNMEATNEDYSVKQSFIDTLFNIATKKLTTEECNGFMYFFFDKVNQ